MRPPKQPRRRANVAPQQEQAAPATEPVREPAPRKPRNERAPETKHRAARNQEPAREPASNTPGTSVRATVAKLRRERTAKKPESAPVPEHRKPSSDPYPLSDKIKIRRQAERKKLFIRLGAVLAVIAALAGVVWLLFFSSVFAVKAENIEITIDDPAGIVDEEGVRDMILEAEGTPVLRLSGGEFEERLEALPEIRAAQVAGALPSGVDVAIVARVPVACVGAADSCIGIAADATQLEIDQDLRDQLPKVTMDLESDRAADQLQGLVDSLAALPEDVRARMERASISGSGLIEFRSEDRTIKWGPSEENEKKARIIAILLDEPASTYDVTVPDAPVTY